MAAQPTTPRKKNPWSRWALHRDQGLATGIHQSLLGNLIVIQGEENNSRLIRKSGEVDIFLLDLPTDDGRGYFNLTSTHGRLTKAAYFDDQPEAVNDAQERFESELGFWKGWMSEKIKQM